MSSFCDYYPPFDLKPNPMKTLYWLTEDYEPVAKADLAAAWGALWEAQRTLKRERLWNRRILSAVRVRERFWHDTARNVAAGMDTDWLTDAPAFCPCGEPLAPEGVCDECER